MLAVLTVGGFYFYARWRAASLIRNIPQKIGLDIQQSASGFSVSKSEEGRTIFTARASKAVQFKQGGRAELHDVNITVYGRDSTRFDQISGAEFTYDPHTGDITATGPVAIDLEANPQGLLNPDQAPPRELKNPLHIRTSGLVFNQKTGNAYTHEKVEFDIATASGWATGASYEAKTGVLTLEREVNITTAGAGAAHLVAAHGVITHGVSGSGANGRDVQSKAPQRVVLDHIRLDRPSQHVEADQATLFLAGTNNIERILARGNVRANGKGASSFNLQAAQAELFMAGEGNHPRRAVFSGDAASGGVKLAASGAGNLGERNMTGSAGRIVLDFDGNSQLAKVHAEEKVRLFQNPSAQASGAAKGGESQLVAIAAPAIDFFVADGKHLTNAVTSGASEITLTPSDANAKSPLTRVTAGIFEARFDEQNHLQSLHGSPDAVVTSAIAGQHDRTSTSQSLDVTFRPTSGMESIAQDGAVHFADGQRQAWAEHARYTPADKMFTLSGAPRVVEQGLTTTAQALRLNRATGEAVAEGNVKSTYSELKPQPGGALLASGDPIHVTAGRMEALRDPGRATYTGDARLWQGANVVQASSIEFDRNTRHVTAQGGSKPVTTVMVEAGTDGKFTLVTISSERLTYADSERRAHFEGRVEMKAGYGRVTADTLDAYLIAIGQDVKNKQVNTPARLEKVVAQGHVLVVQGLRKAQGEQLAYTTAEDKFVLTGGPPSIFDAERGKITGDSLTFYRRDDRVLVEGTASSPTVTRTRVAR